MRTGYFVPIYKSDQRIEFALEPAGLDERWLKLASIRQKASKMWMDAYLASFAELSTRRLVTLDKGFRQFTALDVLVLSGFA